MTVETTATTELSMSQRMTQLCKSIPTVANCNGVEPWDPEKFAKSQYGRSESEKIAASFVLLVWTQDAKRTEWTGLPEFCLTDAAARCDRSVCQVIANWLLDPFWP